MHVCNYNCHDSLSLSVYVSVTIPANRHSKRRRSSSRILGGAFQGGGDNAVHLGHQFPVDLWPISVCWHAASIWLAWPNVAMGKKAGDKIGSGVCLPKAAHVAVWWKEAEGRRPLSSSETCSAPAPRGSLFSEGVWGERAQRKDQPGWSGPGPAGPPGADYSMSIWAPSWRLEFTAVRD